MVSAPFDPTSAEGFPIVSFTSPNSWLNSVMVTLPFAHRYSLFSTQGFVDLSLVFSCFHAYFCPSLASFLGFTLPPKRTQRSPRCMVAVSVTHSFLAIACFFSIYPTPPLLEHIWILGWANQERTFPLTLPCIDPPLIGLLFGNYLRTCNLLFIVVKFSLLQKVGKLKEVELVLLFFLLSPAVWQNAFEHFADFPTFVSQFFYSTLVFSLASSDNPSFGCHPRNSPLSASEIPLFPFLF